MNRRFSLHSRFSCREALAAHRPLNQDEPNSHTEDTAMLTRDQVLRAALHEIDVAKFLAEKIPADRADWRPSETQRSVTELLQYLSRCGISAFEALRAPAEERPAIGKKYRDASASVTLDNFEDAMDKQATQLWEVLDPLSDDDLQEMVALPWGQPVTVGELFLTTVVKFLTAYRMQLFLYMKQMGMSDLGTLQSWVGVDTPEQMQAKFGVGT